MNLFCSVGLLVACLVAVHALIPSHPCSFLPRLQLQQQQRRIQFVGLHKRSTTALPTSASYVPPYASDQQKSPGTIQDLLFFTNQERQRNGLSELRYNKELEKSAQRHASDMAEKNYFSHDGLDGSDLKQRVGNTNYRYTNVGENLFWRTPDNDPAYAVQGWMESAGHRKNVLDPQFSEIGLGYAYDSSTSKHYYVQVFGRPVDAPPTNSAPPPPPYQASQDARDVMIRATNDARRQQGLPPFSMSSELSRGAQEHAEDMLREGELSQKLKRGSYDRFFTNIGARFAARESFNDPQGAVQGWIDQDPSSDILSERFTDTGVGYATNGKQHYYVQLFGTPMETGVGRQDYVGSVGSVVPPIGASGPGIRVPKRDKREDKSRNGDFGRMGFGQRNRDRREDVDEVDDAWADDRKVLQQLQNRPRPGSRRVRDMRGQDPMQDMRGIPSMQANRGSFNIRDTNPVNPMGPRSGPTASSTMGSNSNGVRAPTVGFNDNWNKDYSGTANLGGGNPGGFKQRQGGSSSGMGHGPLSSMQEAMNPYEQFARRQNENLRGPMAGGYAEGDFGYGGGFNPPQMMNGGGPMNNGYNQFNQQGMNMNNIMRLNNQFSQQQQQQQGTRQGMNGGRQGRNGGRGEGFNDQYQQQRYMQQGMQGMQDGRGGYNQYNQQQQQQQQQGMNNNGYNMNRGGPLQRMGSNGRPLRQNTSSAFGKPPQRSNGSNGAVNDIHYRRFQNQVMDNNMMYNEGMDFGFEGPMDFGMGYGGGGMMGPQFGGYGQWSSNAMGRRQ